MKSQLKHFSKSTISVILSICMLVSCMTVGIIATDAAQSAEERVGAADNSEAVGDTTYYLSGVAEDGATNNWSATQQIMTNTSGTTWKILTKANNNFSFKITDGTWDNSWPKDNYNVNEGSGYYVISFDSGTKSISVSKQGDFYVVAGDSGLCGDGWKTNSVSNMMTASGTVYSITYSDLDAGDYEFKITKNNSWDNSIGYSSNVNFGYNISKKGTPSDNGNIPFTVATKKDVIITYNTADGKINISSPETTYPVTVQSADTNKGTVAANSVNAGNTTPVTLPTATEKLGYKFKNWTATSPATIASGDTSATAGKVTATGIGGTVTANWEEKTDLEFFISGRFRVKASDSATNYENTFDSGQDWADNCEKQALQLTRTGAYTYTLDTHCTMKELTTQIGKDDYVGDQVFYVHDKTNSKNYFAGSSKTFSSASGDNVTLVTSGGSNSNLKFDSNNENGYVVLSFDPRTMKLSYTLRGAETTYSVTVSAGTGGSTAVSSVTAGSTKKGYLPIVTPDYGYAFAGWTVTSGGNNITIHNPTANDGTAYVNATAAGTVTATYTVIDPELYIVGRFSYRTIEGDNDSWTHTGNDDFDWNTKSQAAPLTRVGNTSEYILNTYASLSELSANATSGSSSLEHCFYIRDERNGGTDGGNYYASAATLLGNNNTGNGYSNAVTLAFKNSALTDTENSRIYFDSESNDIPVTIHFNVSSKKLWYTTPVFYDVTVATAQNGTVTASPTRTIQGNTVTLKVMPDQHYTASVSAIMDGTSNILQLTPTNTGYTFSMPSGNVTVTPTFTPTNYSISYNSKGSSSANATTDFSDATYNVSLTAPSTSGTNNPVSGSYVNGVSVSAPAQQGYTFYKWVATNGTFTKGSNVTESETADTKFYPTANDATLKALYRKNYTISVTNTTPALGSIAVNPVSNTVLAGDTFTLTATPQTNKKLIGLTLNGTSVISHVDHKVYTGTASGNESLLEFAATFGDIPSTIIYVNKKFADKDYGYKNHIYIWSTEGDKVKALESWPGTQFNSVGTADDSWKVDPIYPDYYRRVFWFDYEDFQVILNNGNTGNMDQTGNSNKVETGKTYTLDEVDVNNCPVLVEHVPVYNVAAEKGLAGGENDWDPTIAANEMTNNNGTFTLTKNNIPKSKHVYKGKDENEQDIYEDYYSYKVATGHNWNNGAHPDSNQNLYVLYNNSTVVFNFNPTTNTLTATVSGGSFDAQVPQTLQNGAAYISDNSSVSTDKSVTLTATKSYTESNYSTAGYTTKNVYVKVALDPHYEVTGWTDGNGAALTPVTTPTVTPSETPDTVGDTVIAQFSVNQDITIVPTITRKHHNVYFTPSPTGGTVKVNGQDASPQSVDEFTNYTITITPQKGYKLKTFKITSDSNTYTFDYDESEQRVQISKTVQMGYYDEYVTVEFEMIGYTLNGTVSPEVTPAHGTLKFYEDGYIDNNGNIDPSKEITTATATYQQEFWVVYVPNDDYVLKNFTVSGPTQPTMVGTLDRDNNRAKYRMGAHDASFTANVMLQYNVNYYIDLHNTDMSKNKKVKVEVVDSSGNIVQKANGKNCDAELSKEGDSTVYWAELETPFKQQGSGYDSIYFKIYYNNNLISTETLNSTQVKKLKNTKEVWLEAVNEESKDLKLTYKTKATPADQNGYRRIYLARPYNWCYTENNEQKGTDQVWNNIGIYYWGSDYGEDGEGWFKGTAMNRIGSDSEYCYYYVDIPKTLNHTIGEQTVKDKIDNIIFQGWSSNTRVGDNTLTPDAQTEDIKQIADSDNFFVLSKNGSTFTAEPGVSVVVPDYTRYVESAQMNVNVYSTLADGSEIKINPTYTGEKITYTSSGEDVVTVDGNGKLTPIASGNATITVRIFGTIGKRLYDYNSSINADYRDIKVSVTINDPGKLNSFELMSLESAEYTVNIPKVGENSNVIPGYFDMSKVNLTVTGIKGLTSSTTSAIVTESSEDTVVVDGKTYPTSFTVKYAIPMNEHGFDGYSGIKVTGSVVTKTIAREGSRFGISSTTPWKCYTNSQGDTGTTVDPSPDVSKVIKDSVETATTESIVFNSTYVKYSAIFEEYKYVDVTFVYDYFEYNPKVKDGMIEYPYDPVYAGPENRNDAGFNKGDYANTHNKVIYTVEKYEVRGIDTSTIAENEDLVDAAITALGVGPDNNYYDYHITVDTLDLVANSINTQTFTATVNVHMTHSVKTYNVYLNGEPKERTPNPDDSNDKRKAYYYQEYVELTAPQDDNLWYAVDDRTTTDVSNSPLLATGSSYKFRVKGTSVNRDTYLRTAQGSAPDDDHFNRSEVDFSHYETVHQGETLKEYLLQNFYIADFFSPEKFLDQSRPKDGGGYLPYDDVKFVGGGVVYYSVDEQGNPRSNNAVGLGYVNSDGTLNQDAAKEMLKSEILASVNEGNYGKYTVEEDGQTVQKSVSYESLENAIGTEDALKVAYGTEIAAHQYVENNIKTGVLYRYLPLETFSKDSDNWSNGVPVKDGKGNYYTTLNNNTFRYSNTLQSYQYVYASGNENKETNAGKNMRLYSYYVYSYVAYNQETNVPETKYEIVLSDNYSDASTYWNGK